GLPRLALLRLALRVVDARRVLAVGEAVAVVVDVVVAVAGLGAGQRLAGAVRRPGAVGRAGLHPAVAGADAVGAHRPAVALAHRARHAAAEHAGALGIVAAEEA